MDYYREVDSRAGQVRKRRPQSEAQREVLALQQPGALSRTASSAQEVQLPGEEGAKGEYSEEREEGGRPNSSNTEPSLREGDFCVWLCYSPSNIRHCTLPTPPSPQGLPVTSYGLLSKPESWTPVWQ